MPISRIPATFEYSVGTPADVNLCSFLQVGTDKLLSYEKGRVVLGVVFKPLGKLYIVVIPYKLSQSVEGDDSWLMFIVEISYIVHEDTHVVGKQTEVCHREVLG